MSTILALTHARDGAADMVIGHLVKLGADVVRFNTDEFHRTVKFCVDLDSSSDIQLKFRFPNREVDAQEIDVVWNRRIHRPLPPEELSNEPALQEWAEEETEWGLNNALTLIQAPFINPWEANERLKFNKWLQMERAVKLGFEVPRSRMTNELPAVKEFWESVNQDMIFKKIRRGLLHMSDGRRLLFHTSRIPVGTLDESRLERMRFCPVFLQEHIPKRYDVRTIVVGEQVFSVVIHSQDVPEGQVDFRTAGVKGKLREMKHEPMDLGADVNRRLVAFVKSFGLTFSAIDLVITPDDRLMFLEDNPNGQWAWLEELTGVPISHAIAELLISFVDDRGTVKTMQGGEINGSAVDAGLCHSAR